MRKGIRRNERPTNTGPLRYSKHPSYGARIFFNDSGYQAHTVVCWFERDRLDRKHWVFRMKRRGAEIPPAEFNRHYLRARALLKRNGLNPETATYADIVELAKSMEGRPGRFAKTEYPSLMD